MPAVTGNGIIAASFGILNVYLPGETPNANDANFALGVLNRMIGSWAQRVQTVPVVARETFDLEADKGGPTNPYTIGDGGDFDTEKPPNQNSVVSANLVLTSTDPEVRIPLAIYTDQAYDAIQVPDLSNTLPTGVYYDPTYANDLGSLHLWPVPDNATNDLELFLQKPIVRFADLTTTYYLPEGYDDALVYNLAKRLAGPFGRQLTADDAQVAVTSLGVIKRANLKLSDLANDVTFTAFRRTLYNIQTGQ